MLVPFPRRILKLGNVRLFCSFGRGKEAVLGLQDISYDILCSLYDCFDLNW
jgi:hypothetical protein